MIKILYDHQIFSEQRYGGISRYFANLCKGINKSNIGKVRIGVCYSKNYYLKFYPQVFNNVVGRWFLRKDHKRYRWNKKYSKTLLKKGDHDIFHATYYDPYSLNYNTKPMVITIHDMIHENNPEMFADSPVIIAQKQLMMNAATAIIAISNFTFKEIVRFYPQLNKKITVVYHGINNHDLDTANDVEMTGKFLLFVGERGNYKNFNMMAKALAPLLLKEKELKLICAGGKEFTNDEKKLLDDRGILAQCIQINASDDVLTQLYQKALVFVYPSSQEGFGLPILEAFQNHCAIACSESSCLPEIGGDAVQYFDPENEDSILSAVESLIFDSAYAAQLKEKGQKRLRLFTMEKCIENTLEVYKNALINPL